MQETSKNNFLVNAVNHNLFIAKVVFASFSDRNVPNMGSSSQIFTFQQEKDVAV